MTHQETEILEYIFDLNLFLERATIKNKVALINRRKQLEKYKHYTISKFINNDIECYIEKINKIISEV